VCCDSDDCLLWICSESSKNELLETIPTTNISGNHPHSKMVLEYNTQKPFSQQIGFGVQLTETIFTAKWF